MSELNTWEQAQYDGVMLAYAYAYATKKVLDAHASIQGGIVSIIDASV